MTPAIVFLTGASGSGKTTLVRALETEGRGAAVYQHFDSIGVPDRGAMVREFGSGERWQAETTRRWIARIAREHATTETVVLEGQSRPSFILSAFAEHGIARSRIVLVHCADGERDARLVTNRNQPELASDEMRAWAAFLHRDALARGLPIIDTTGVSRADAARRVLRIVESLRGR